MCSSASQVETDVFSKGCVFEVILQFLQVFRKHTCVNSINTQVGTRHLVSQARQTWCYCMQTKARVITFRLTSPELYFHNLWRIWQTVKHRFRYWRILLVVQLAYTCSFRTLSFAFARVVICIQRCVGWLWDQMYYVHNDGVTSQEVTSQSSICNYCVIIVACIIHSYFIVVAC